MDSVGGYVEHIEHETAYEQASAENDRYRYAAVFALRILLGSARVCDDFMDDPNTLLRLLGKRVLWSKQVLDAILCSLDASEEDCLDENHLRERFVAQLRSEQAWAAYVSTVSYLYAENPTLVIDDLRLNLLKLESAGKIDAPSSSNIVMIQQLLDLSTVERRILEFAKAITHRWFRLFGREISGLGIQEAFGLLAAAVAAPVTEVRKVLRADAPLRNFGVLRVETTPPDLEDFVILGATGKCLISNEFSSSDEMRQEFMVIAQAPVLAAADYPHMATELRLLTTYLRKVSEDRLHGVNILLYGPPGTGKSEFSRVLAGQAGLTGYEVPTANRDGLPVSGQVRLTCFSMCQRFLERMGNAMLTFDEIEDAFSTQAQDGGHGDTTIGRYKGWLNQQLENARVPAIWISNSIEDMDPALLRRFSFHIQFRTPPKSVRERVIRRCLNDAVASDSLVAALSSDDTLSPAQVSVAGKFATLSSETSTLDESALLMAANASQLAMGRASTLGLRADRTASCKLEYLNLGADVSIEKIEHALRRTPAASMCFYGVSGAGKTSLAHHIADAIDRPVLLRRASDLFGMYLGQSEKRIAQMFRDAHTEGAVLLLDEADSFLRSRTDAHHSWQISVVNELLQQMEAFEGVFICTTNLMDEVDSAAMRRFTFKIRFDVMTPAQREALFAETVMGAPQAELPESLRGQLAQLVSATPGDFANVQRQANLLGEPLDAEAFLRRLAYECAMKPAAKVKQMGFLH